jgi:hypothetical protein
MLSSGRIDPLSSRCFAASHSRISANLSPSVNVRSSSIASATMFAPYRFGARGIMYAWQMRSAMRGDIA